MYNFNSRPAKESNSFKGNPVSSKWQLLGELVGFYRRPTRAECLGAWYLDSDSQVVKYERNAMPAIYETLFSVIESRERDPEAEWSL